MTINIIRLKEASPQGSLFIELSIHHIVNIKEMFKRQHDKEKKQLYTICFVGAMQVYERKFSPLISPLLKISGELLMTVVKIC